jgi:hypothetical protein
VVQALSNEYCLGPRVRYYYFGELWDAFEMQICFVVQSRKSQEPFTVSSRCHIWSRECGSMEIKHGVRHGMRSVLTSISVILISKCARDNNRSGDVFIRTCI